MNVKEPSSTYSKGYNIHGKVLKEQIADVMCKSFERVNNLDGAMFFSHLGGAGSDLYSSMIELFKERFKGKGNIGINITPSLELGSEPLEIYNVVLAFNR